jgi:hypothetical protein
LEDLSDGTIATLEATAKHYKISYLASISFTEVLISLPSVLTLHLTRIPVHRKQKMYDLARNVFKDLVYKNLDWPEAIWEAWMSFDLYGAVQDVDKCLDKIDRARTQLNACRLKVGSVLSYCYDKVR